MAEYIEREAIMQKFADNVKRSNNSDFAPTPTWNQAVQIVEDIPAADVRPVVFCKNCMHSVQGKKALECEKHRYVWNNMNRWVNDEDFCCWGAKREES